MILNPNPDNPDHVVAYQWMLLRKFQAPAVLEALRLDLCELESRRAGTWDGPPDPGGLAATLARARRPA